MLLIFAELISASVYRGVSTYYIVRDLIRLTFACYEISEIHTDHMICRTHNLDKHFRKQNAHAMISF